MAASPAIPQSRRVELSTGELILDEGGLRQPDRRDGRDKGNNEQKEQRQRYSARENDTMTWTSRDVSLRKPDC